jgi:hypothetical protein
MIRNFAQSDIDPEALMSVRVELTKVLPGLWGVDR